MATIGSFFAELGFKVNASQLKTANSTLKQINNAYKQLTAELKQQGLELKNQLEAEKVATQAKKTALQASKAKEAQMKAETAEIKRNIAEINLQNKSLKVHQNQLLEIAGTYGYIKKGIKNVFGGVFKGVSEGFYRIDRWTAQTRQTALEYRDFARQTGMPVERLQQYQAAGETVGSNLTSSQIAQDIKELQQRAQKIVYGKGDVSPYQMLGIVPNKRDAYEVLEGLRNKIDGLTDSAALMWIRNIGLSDDWLHILRMSKDEFNSMEKVMLSQEQIKKTTALAMGFRQIQFALKQLKDQFVAFIAGPLGNFISNFKMMTLDLAAFLKTMTGSKEAFATFAAGLALVVLAFAPVTAAIAALLLLWEDFYVGTHGGKSLFDWGDLDDFEKFKETLSNGIKEMTEIIQNFISSIKSLYDWLNVLFDPDLNWMDKLEKLGIAKFGDSWERPQPKTDEPKKKTEHGWLSRKLEEIGWIKWVDSVDKNNDVVSNSFAPSSVSMNKSPISIQDNRTVETTINVKSAQEAVDIQRDLYEDVYNEDILLSGPAYEQLGNDRDFGSLIKADKAVEGKN